MDKVAEKIRLGARVSATDGEIGEVRRFFIDPESQRAEQMTVGGLSGERVVSLLNVKRVEDGKVYLDLDKKRVQELALFNENAYRDPGLREGRLPDWADEGNRRADLQVRGDVGQVPVDAEGDRAGSTAVDTNYTPLDQREPVISTDTAVLDANGNKIGTVAAFAIDQVTGIPAGLGVRRGLLPGNAIDVTPDEIQTFAPEGVVLRVSELEIKNKK